MMGRWKMIGDTNSRLDDMWEKLISITDRVNWIGDAMGRILSDIRDAVLRLGRGWDGENGEEVI